MTGVSSEVPRVSTARIDAIEDYIRNNRGHCRYCQWPVIWCPSQSGKTIPLDFAKRGPKTHHIVPTSKDGTYTGEVTAYPTDRRPTHSCHLDTCEKRNR